MFRLKSRKINGSGLKRQGVLLFLKLNKNIHVNLLKPTLFFKRRFIPISYLGFDNM
jgi:hypothetical protein